jgi:hypothetical protein
MYLSVVLHVTDQKYTATRATLANSRDVAGGSVILFLFYDSDLP